MALDPCSRPLDGGNVDDQRAGGFANCRGRLGSGIVPARSRQSLSAALPVGSALRSDSPTSDVTVRIADPARFNAPVSPTWRFQLAFWLPFLIGIAIFGIYSIASKRSLAAHGFPPDLRGVQEAANRLYPASIAVLLQSIFVMLPQVIAFAFPVSVALPFFFSSTLRNEMDPAQRRVALALVIAVLTSWLICVASGMTNPRYAYPTLLPLCPLAGGVAIAACKTPRTAEWLRGIVSITVIALVLATVGLSIVSWKAPHFKPVLIVCALLATFLTIWTVHALARSWHSAWGLVALALIASIPFGLQRKLSRTEKDSGLSTALKLRSITGENAIVACGGIVTSKPETLYYAKVQPDFHPTDFTPGHVKPGTWVLLDQAEHRQWLSVPGVHLEKDQKLCRYGSTDYFIAWYAR